MSPEKLAEQYEKVVGYVVCEAEPPTAESIALIESSLGITLPDSLVRFAAAAPRYGNWLASLGPDYDSPTHILNINRPGQIPYKPDNFVIINVGYDEDYECIDLETLDRCTGEYLITYWSPTVPQAESALYESFMDCMASNIKFWSE